MTKPDGTCTVKIVHSKASLRTRRIVKKSGPFFEWFTNTNRTDAILLRSPMTGWSGWLPLDEIEWTN